MDYSKLMDNDKIQGKKYELQKLAESKDAEKIKDMVEEEKLKKALDNGDTETLRKTIAGVLQTKEGARLLSQLEQMFK